jgi:hypothetical protein
LCRRKTTDTTDITDATGSSRDPERRKFHSGSRSHDTKSEIAALGYIEERRAPKLRFAFGITREAKKTISAKRLNDDRRLGNARLAIAKPGNLRG